MIKETTIAVVVGITIGAVAGILTSIDRPAQPHGYVTGGARCGQCRKEYDEAPHYRLAG